MSFRVGGPALLAAAVLAACFGTRGYGQAQQDYPNRIVQIVNPYQAGSTTDVLARGLAVGMASRLGQQFVVVDKPGAGGALGTASVARAEPDGYTLLFAPALVVSVHPAARSDTGYEASALSPICQTFSNAMALAVRPDSPFQSLADLVGAARAKPGGLNYGHQGPSTIPHLAMEEFLDSAKLEINGIPFRGEPVVMTDLIGGRLDVAAIVLGSATGGNVRLLGIFADERHRAFPDVPTVKEQGIRREPDELRRFAGSSSDAAGDRGEACRRVRGGCDGRIIRDERATGGAAGELLRRPRDLQCASATRHRGEEAAARAHAQAALNKQPRARTSRLEQIADSAGPR